MKDWGHDLHGGGQKGSNSADAQQNALMQVVCTLLAAQTNESVYECMQRNGTGQLGNFKNPADACSDKKWYIFTAASLTILLTGLFLIALMRLMLWVIFSPRDKDKKRLESFCDALVKSRQFDQHWWAETKAWSQGLISGQTSVGKVMVATTFLFSVISLIVYMVDTLLYHVESCMPWNGAFTRQIDLVLNMYFLINFFLRFVAAEDKLIFWTNIYSIVDYFTIPPVILETVMNRSWIGLRFMRAICFMQFSDILQFLHILRTGNSIRLAQLASIFLTVWVASAGMFYLLENTGDPFYSYQNSHDIDYFNCMYYLLVTMSTVGYGDVTPTTVLGKIFVVLYILGALAMFATFIPEMVECISTDKYGGEFEKEPNKPHIVLCGNIDYRSVDNFLKDFLHEDREDINITTVLLDKQTPSLELQALMKRHFTKVQFFRGTVMNSRDLCRVKVSEADACLVIANKNADDPHAEDMANIMRVIAVKNYCQNIRIIVQLLCYSNKIYLMNIPGWNKEDCIVCLPELKLGFMAQSCLAPGFSTLLANLFTMRSDNVTDDMPDWMKDYVIGAGMEMYKERLSYSFTGMSFPDMALLCFFKLNLLLVALQQFDETYKETTLIVNPGSDVHIVSSAEGYFIAQSAEEAKRAFYYCKICHDKVSDPDQIKKCAHTEERLRPIKPSDSSNKSKKWRTQVTAMKVTPSKSNSRLAAMVEYLHLRKGQDKPQEMFDETGMFHWCPERPIEACLVTRKEIQQMNMRNHIIVCIFADTQSPQYSLNNFMMPLRASNIHYNELKHVVLIGDENWIRTEWPLIQNFPIITVLPGAPLNRGNLKAANIQYCDMVVILSPKVAYEADKMLVDKETILCSLNIKAMTFDDVEDVPGGDALPNSSHTTDIDVIERLRAQVKRRVKLGHEIPMISELECDTNVQFLDIEDEDTPDAELYLSQPFACGTAFVTSVLDSLMSTAYFSSGALAIIQSLVTGGATVELEEALVHGDGTIRHCAKPAMLANRYRCRINQISLRGCGMDEFETFGQCGGTYGDLFEVALTRRCMLCIGIYRKIPATSKQKASHKRCTITNPSKDFWVSPDDKVFVLQPFDDSLLIREVQQAQAAMAAMQLQVAQQQQQQQQLQLLPPSSQILPLSPP